MHPSILGIGTAVPAHEISQNVLAEKMIEIFQMAHPHSTKLRKLYHSSGILSRYSVLSDFLAPREASQFWGKEFPLISPGMSSRNKVYKEEAPKLAEAAARQAMKNWGGTPGEITHLISVSCTGVMAPGIEFELTRLLQLDPQVHRLPLNFLGCFGACKGLEMAALFAKTNPKARILLVCTELCSLHLQGDLSENNLIGHALFGDGAAAVVVGGNPKINEIVLWNIMKNYSYALENSSDRITWEASDTGFVMHLCKEVPEIIKHSISAFSHKLLEGYSTIEKCDWAIHPGGKKIIKAVETALKLEAFQTEASWKTLANYGNISSASLLFVLDSLRKQSIQKEWCAGLAFGPGLSIEGILLGHNW